MMPKQRLIIAIVTILLVGGRAYASDKDALEFQQRVLPLLKNRCVACHGPAEQEGGLNLAIPPGIVRGGDSGPAVVAGKLDESLLWQRVAADEMPPEGDSLPKEEKEILRAWIAGGATGLPREVSADPQGDEHWAFQKLQKTAVPQVMHAEQVLNPIDAFILAPLEKTGLKLSEPADRHTLIRRVALDLTGLPPTLDEIEQFTSDTSPQAYEAMVDRYLASPHYGERWGKLWLDTAGYADSNGYFGADTDRPLAYRYRDYVIRSVNEDKPFDQFIREQLAGDELVGYAPGKGISAEMIGPLEATHYLRNSPDGTDSSDGNPDEVRADKYAVLEGTMQIMGASLFGLTVQCAKCHDHKYEPFSQKDFYQLQALVYPAFNLEKWVKPKNREIMAASAEEVAAWKKKSAAVDKEIARHRTMFKTWLRENRERGLVLFEAAFDDDQSKLATDWSNAVPGDASAAGQPAVNIDSTTAPGAFASKGTLKIVESRDDGDRVFSSKQIFDWTPNKVGGWIQVSFDLEKHDEPSPYIGYFIALKDFNDEAGFRGGNVLIDGAASGKATIYVDYPGSDTDKRGSIGNAKYNPGQRYGVRVTNRGNGRYELAHYFDGILEPETLILSEEDLPDGGFGFEYCCGRSFAIDNLVIESSDKSFSEEEQNAYLAKREKRFEQFEKERKRIEAERGPRPGQLAMVTDLTASMPDVYLLERGDYGSRGEKVKPLPPGVLCETEVEAESAFQPVPQQASTGVRLAFAKWITAPDARSAALLARVTVNRWWANHFGRGIVASVENLGYSGAPPSHPELLEYLATQFIRQGWSQKAIHRLIVTSATYRQKSLSLEEQVAADEENMLFGRFPLLRLDAEAIRDSMLAASGEIDLKAGGRYVATRREENGDVVVDESTPGAKRRSVYLQQRRTQVLGLLEVFDAPSIVFSCTARVPTTVPLQSLKMLNSAFVRDRAKAFARRIAENGSDDPEERIRQAYRLSVSREPTARELQLALEFIASQPQNYEGRPDATEQVWTDFCQMLFSSNAFLYRS